MSKYEFCQKHLTEAHDDKQGSEEIKELLFSGGAGCIGFMMGFLHGLIEIVGKEKLREYKLGGVSAGNAAALFFHMSLHQDKYDMKYFHHKEISKYFAKENKKYFGLFTNNRVIENNTLEYCKLLEELGDKIPNLNGIYHCVVTEYQGWFKFKKTIIDRFDNMQNLSTAIQSSCQIPFFTSFNVFSKHKESKMIDGGFTGTVPYKYENSKKILLNMMPKFANYIANFKKTPKNLKVINITKNSGIVFPRDYYIWNEEWNDEMFLKGYFSAMANIQEICEIFEVELKPKTSLISQQVLEDNLVDINKIEQNIQQEQEQRISQQINNHEQILIDQLNNTEIIQNY